MNRSKRQLVEELLERPPISEVDPPAELLDRIRADIPEALDAAEAAAEAAAESSTAPPENGEGAWPASGSGSETRHGRGGMRWLAASLAVAVLGGLLASRVARDPHTPALQDAMEAAPDSEPAEVLDATSPNAIAGDAPAEPALDSSHPIDGPAATSISGERARALRESMESRSAVDETAARGRPAPAQAEVRLEAKSESAPVNSTQPQVPTATPDGAGSTITNEELQRIPDARDPFPGRVADLSVGSPVEVAPMLERRAAFSSEEKSVRADSEYPKPKALTRKIWDAGVPSRRQDRRWPPSTGGGAEPNDRPYGDVFFESAGVNPFIDTEDDRLSTFALDVDTGSYSIARRYLHDGHLPPPAAIRVEEFVNSFDYGNPAPRRDDFAISLEGAPSPFAAGSRYRLVRIGIRARDVRPARRKPTTLIFVVDTSGSMERENRLGLVVRALGLLLDELDKDDRVGLVEYGNTSRVVVEPTRDRDRVERALGRLLPRGSTNVEAGLDLGYELADEFFRNGVTHRLILCSDGVANVGGTSADAILQRIEREARAGIELTTIGVGMGNYNDVLLEQLADRGNGRYAYVDTLDEARKIFVENLTGTLQTVAFDAKAQVEFDPATVSRYRLLGYENRDVADHRFRDDGVDAGEIGAGHTVTALYEIKLQPDAPRDAEIATVRLRWQPAGRARVREVSERLRISQLETRWNRAPASLQLATLVAEFAEILRRSHWARGSEPADILELSRHLPRRLTADPEVGGFLDLVEIARDLRKQEHPPED